MFLPKHGIQESVKRIQYCIVWTIEFYRLLYLMLTMLYSTRSLDYRFGHRSHMLFAVTGRRVCIITCSGLSEGFQFHPEHIICSVDSFSIVSLGKMIQLQMHFGFNQSLQLDSSASNEQHKNNFFYPVLQCHFYHDPMKKVIFFYPLPILNIVVIQNCLSSKTFRFQWHFLL